MCCFVIVDCRLPTYGVCTVTVTSMARLAMLKLVLVAAIGFAAAMEHRQDEGWKIQINVIR